MSDGKNVRMITPPNRLKAKVRGKMPQMDADMIARAEASLKALSGNFAVWMNDEVEKLSEAYRKTVEVGLDSDEGEAFYRCAHDVKGLGTTYEFPLVSRLAGSLCKLVNGAEERKTAPRPLVKAHVDAITAAVREQQKGDGSTVAQNLIVVLEEQVREHIAAHPVAS